MYYNRLTDSYLFSLAVDCGSLSAPVNGTLVGEKTTFPNVLKFSCDKGFTQHGAIERRCQSNGSWSGNETSCQGILHLLNMNTACTIKRTYANYIYATSSTISWTTILLTSLQNGCMKTCKAGDGDESILKKRTLQQYGNPLKTA